MRIEDTFGEKIGGSRRDLARDIISGRMDFTEEEKEELPALATLDRLWPYPAAGIVANANDDRELILRACYVDIWRAGLPRTVPKGLYSAARKNPKCGVDAVRWMGIVREARDAAEKFVGDGDVETFGSELKRLSDIFDKIKMGLLFEWRGTGLDARTTGGAVTACRKVATAFMGVAGMPPEDVFGEKPKESRAGLSRFIEELDWPKKRPDARLVGRLLAWVWRDPETVAGKIAEFSGKPRTTARKRGYGIMRPPVTGVRIGPSCPENIDPETFQETFAFRGGEFGNWMSQDDRRENLAAAHLAFMDLADMLDIAPREIGRGELAFAFGARGHGGKACAHYEPLRKVINLTKTAGAGATAHEWAHFLDHISGDAGTKAITDMVRPLTSGDIRARQLLAIAGQRDRILSRLPREDRKPILRVLLDIDPHEDGKAYMKTWEKMLTACIREDNSWNATHSIASKQFFRNWLSDLLAQGIEPNPFAVTHLDFAEDAKRLGKYWADPKELFARAFESFVHDRLLCQQRHSPYLVNRYEVTDSFEDGDIPLVYPSFEDRLHLRKVMPGILDEMFAKAGPVAGENAGMSMESSGMRP